MKKKLEGKNKWETRDFVVTSQRVLNLKKSNIQRQIPIENIQALTQCDVKEESQFIIHIKDDYDQHAVAERRDEIFKFI